MIDYQRLGRSVDFYQKMGFTQIDTPWYVDYFIKSLTKPDIEVKNDFNIEKINKSLVASAEQSFLSLIFKNQLPVGKYQSITPCFRDDEYTDISRKCFIKNELIIFNRQDSVYSLEEELESTIMCAKKFMEEEIEHDLFVLKINDERSIVSYDIMAGEYELGSYGIRNYKNLVYWVYATGCAEPRFTTVKNILNGD